MEEFQMNIFNVSHHTDCIKFMNNSHHKQDNLVTCDWYMSWSFVATDLVQVGL